MNMQSVIKINNVICERLNNHQAIMHGRRIQLHKTCYVTNHVQTGKFKAIQIKNRRS